MKSTIIKSSGLNNNVNDIRISKIIPMIPPVCMIEDLPITDKIKKVVTNTRQEISNILNCKDDRILVICGPCSIHDPVSALEYAQKLKILSDEVKNDVLIVMRTYFEKPRTTYGWKGLINDPYLDDTCHINHGMKMARKLLLDINCLGMPCGYECLDTITPQYIADVISWAAIGARTTESQVHRQLASGLSMPVGFKNGTTGSINIAANAIISARHKHCFLSITKQGLVAIVKTEGNKDTHIILRGSETGPNYSKLYVQNTENILKQSNITPRIMVDCSHGNSGKDYKNQPIVCSNVCQQISNNNLSICGIMLESHIYNGKQTLIIGESNKLIYGRSITDSCMDFDTTKSVIKNIVLAVRERREKCHI